MKCVCVQTCYIKDDEGKPRLYEKGQVANFKNPGQHFKKLGVDFDILTATEAELLETKWSFEEAKATYKEKYGVTLRKYKDKDKIVNQMLDVRFRAIN